MVKAFELINQIEDPVVRVKAIETAKKNSI